MLTTKTISAVVTAVAFTFAGTAAAMAFPATVIDSGKLHTKASNNAKVIGAVKYGQTVNVIDCVKGETWCLVVKKNSQKGWVRANNLDLDYYDYEDDYGFYDPKPGVKICLGGWQGSICISD